jgi:S-adenosylmethionine synthetase
MYENGMPVGISTIVVLAQTKPDVQLDVLRKIIKEEVLKPLIGDEIDNCKVLINPTGAFVVGVLNGDTGLTGRKIIVDTYGGYARHGIGAFSGKDVSKVDRSASYYARYVAKAIGEAELAEQCEVCVSYSIGVAEPVSVYINTFNIGVMDDSHYLNLFQSSLILLQRTLDVSDFRYINNGY